MKTAKVFSVVLLVCASALVAEGKWTFTPSGTSTVAGTLTDGNWTFTLTGKSTGGVSGSQITEVTSVSGGDLDLTDVYEDTGAADGGIKIVTIANNCSLSNTGITSFKTGPWMRTLGNGIMQNCATIRTVEIDEGLTSIGYAAFSSRQSGTQKPSGLAVVKLPSTLTSIGGHAFSGTTNLTTIVPFLPPRVSSFADNSFLACAATGRLTLASASLTTIPSQCFSSCGKITELDLSDSITTISSGFSGCSGITNLVSGVPASLTSCYQAFSGCSKLGGALDLSPCQSLQTLGQQAFDSMAITKVILPPGVTNIAKRAFRKCGKLKSVVASEPGALKKMMKETDGIIGPGAFDNANQMTEVEIPWGGRTIFQSGTEGAAFAWCSSLTNIWFLGKAPPADCIDFMTNGPAAYKCVLDVSKQADEAGWRALGRDLTEAEKAKTDKPEGRVFGIVEKPAGKEAWLRWKASPLYPSGLILLMR